MVRKSSEWKSPSLNIGWQTRHDVSKFRPPFDLLDYSVEGFDELAAQTRPATLVPQGRSLKAGFIVR